MKISIYNRSTSEIIDTISDSYETLQEMAKLYFDIDTDDQQFNFDDFTKLKDGDTVEVTKASANPIDIEQLKYDASLLSQVSYSLLFLKVELNDFVFKVMLDTGAQSNVMTEQLANSLGLSHLIDTSTAGYAKGVGVSKILGTVCGCNLKLGDNMFIPINFRIMESDAIEYMGILGMEFLSTYNCHIDITNRTVVVGGTTVKCLKENEIDTYDKPFNTVKDKIRDAFMKIMDKSRQKDKLVELVNRIIDGIMYNPTNDKFKIINKNSKILTSTVDHKDNFLNFMDAIGFKDIGTDKIKFVESIDVLKYAKEIMIY